jgi:chromosome condensin MukBEF ATPase and DNA-binding subunit MukB
MSVILINDLKGYSRLLEGIEMFRLKEKEFIGRSTEFSNEIAKQLFILHTLNVKSWNDRYKNDITEQMYTEKEFVSSLLNSKVSESYNTVEQVLKSLQFLKYQIEDYDLKLDWEESTAIKWLNALIYDCESYLLRKFTQYDSCKWGL